MSRRSIRTVLLLAALVLPAGCGATAPVPAPAALGPARLRAAEVARAWPGSALERAWRDGYYPLAVPPEWLPEDAFHSGDDKFAYWSGRLELRTPLPASGPDAEVVWRDGARLTLPLLPAGRVLAGLTEGRPPCQDHCTPLSVTAVRAGTRQVDTSRGPATIPVWEFGVAGYTDPFSYPAVLPRPPLTAWGEPRPRPFAEQSASWSGTSPDGLTLTGTVTLGGCDRPLPGEVYETDRAVVLIARRDSGAEPAAVCPASATAGTETFRLGRPLGTRVVLDLSTGEPQAGGRPAGAAG
ncbi:hypothetical protein ACFC1R_11755 [Kitasatospora sp. NPDC056138]|uniref:hypothetical protein n=1 Tax=Kitasatospora sp. NPDC056138 TaxID=3345724 RepID=UPI0035DFA54A